MGSKKKSKKSNPKAKTGNRFTKLKWINKYTLTLTVFAIWVSFFDNHNLIKQNKAQKAIEGLEQQKEDYLVKLEHAQKQKKDLSTNMEKLAREKYNFAHPNEDVFIIESENKK